MPAACGSIAVDLKLEVCVTAELQYVHQLPAAARMCVQQKSKLDPIQGHNDTIQHHTTYAWGLYQVTCTARSSAGRSSGRLLGFLLTC
jgi:hypothetical protein